MCTNSENMTLYNAMKQPPHTALKAIAGGNLKGKSDINPQWRLEIMTATFGPVGIGWKYSLDKLWTETGAQGEIMCFAIVSVFIKQNGEWSDPIPGIGGNVIVTANKNGLQSNDEGFKMAVTDALSVAMKALGVAGDVYAGRWDGSKYSVQEAGATAPQPETADSLIKKAEQATSVDQLNSLWTSNKPLQTDARVKAKFSERKQILMAAS